MLRILKEIAERVPDEHPTLGTREAERLREEIEELEPDATDLERWRLHVQLGFAELRLGNLREAIEHLTEAHRRLPADEGNDRRLRDYANQTRFQLGIAYMRLGETENCCLLHTGESCVVPIQGGGVHSKQEGSRQAIPLFLEVLENPPGEACGPPAWLFDSEKRAGFLQAAGGVYHDPSGWLLHHSARWLLNLAYMTLGGYPDQVPPEHRIDPAFFRSEVDFPRFRNIGPELGLNTFNLSGGAIADDFDGDGRLDIVTSTWDPAGPMHYFHNEGGWVFTERTEEANLGGLYGGLNMVQADYDGDGNLDILVLRGAWLRSAGRHPNSLLRNRGDGTFEDVTFEAGLGEVHYPTKTGAWADYDQDGDLDLYIGNESTPDVPAPSQLFRNNGDGTFTDVAARAGLDEKLFALGAVWGDYDGDRFPDLFVSRGGANRLYRNRGDGTFVNVARKLRVTRPRASFATWFWDYDNDGVLDLFVTSSTGSIGILAINLQGLGVPSEDPAIRSLQERFNDQVERMALYRGDGHGGFEEVGARAGLSYPAQPMGANFGDLQNDGYLDFYLATGNVMYEELRPNVMFANVAGERFVNVTMAGGFGHLQKGHGVSFADLDGDGDLDVYVQLGGAAGGDRYHDALFENPGFGNRWIAVQLTGRRSNRSALGARIHARIVEAGAERSVYRHVTSGGSFGANPLRQTLGLGRAEAIRGLEVYWPTTDLTQVFLSPPLDHVLQIVEDVE